MGKLKVSEIIETLKQYTILEINELIKEIEKEFDISANFAVAASSSDSGSADSKEVAQSEFSLHLTNAGANKISVIKVVRELTGVGLMEAKKIVDSVPSLVKEAIPSEEVEEIKKKFTDAGAAVEFK